MLPFFIESNIAPIRLFERDDGRFQVVEPGEIGPFLPGYGYLLVERELAQFLVAHDVERIICKDVVIFDAHSGEEFRTHVRILVEQNCSPARITDLDVSGPRLLRMNDEYYFVSPELKALLQRSAFDYFRFSEGLQGFAG